jgi:hypothetical protein
MKLLWFFLDKPVSTYLSGNFLGENKTDLHQFFSIAGSLEKSDVPIRYFLFFNAFPPFAEISTSQVRDDLSCRWEWT